MHWPGKGGKGNKVWKCVVLECEEEAEAAVRCTKRARTRVEPLEEPLGDVSDGTGIGRRRRPRAQQRRQPYARVRAPPAMGRVGAGLS